MNGRQSSLAIKDFGSHPATGVAIDAGLVYVEIAFYVLGAALGEVSHLNRNESFLNHTRYDYDLCGLSVESC